MIFKEEAEVAFSESAWTIVTTIPTAEIQHFSEHLASWLKDVLNTVRKPALTNSLYHGLSELITYKSNLIIAQLKTAERRLESGLRILSHKRARRGLVDGVGKGLEWLFGVSTTADLE